MRLHKSNVPTLSKNGCTDLIRPCRDMRRAATLSAHLLLLYVSSTVEIVEADHHCLSLADFWTSLISCSEVLLRKTIIYLARVGRLSQQLNYPISASLATHNQVSLLSPPTWQPLKT
jgi:hypothetical protein